MSIVRARRESRALSSQPPTAEDLEPGPEPAASEEGLIPADKSIFASLKIRDYALLWSGLVGSAFAMNMQLVAQGWLVYEMTLSALNLAWVTLSFMVPQVAFALVGGVLADRLRKRQVILYGQALNGVATLFMAIIVMTGNVTFWDFIWVGFLNGTLLALSMPARTAFIPEIVGEPLMFNAMAFSTGAWNLSRILGPAAAGFLIAVFAGGDTTSHFGVGLVYFVLSVLYIVSSVTVLFMRHTGKPSRRRAATGPVRDVIDGIDYARRSPIVGGLILLSIVPFLFGMPINTLMPAFNTDVMQGGPDDLGLLMTAMGVGAILGSLLLAKMGTLRHKGIWLFLTCFLWGGTVAACGAPDTAFWAMAAVGAVGFMSAVNMSMNRTIVTLQVSPAMRGRVMSIDMMSHGLMPLGILPISYIAQAVSVQVAFVVSGVLLSLITVGLWFWLREVRAIDQGFAVRSD